MHRMFRPTTDKEPTMTVHNDETAGLPDADLDGHVDRLRDDKPTDADKLAQRIKDELLHFKTKWKAARVDVRAKLVKDLADGSRVDRARSEHFHRVEAFAEVAHQVSAWTVPALLGQHAADRMMDHPDADVRTAWATVLRITLGKH